MKDGMLEDTLHDGAVTIRIIRMPHAFQSHTLKQSLGLQVRFKKIELSSK